MPDKIKLKAIAAVLCEDVRREENGKQILIGVYSGDIVSMGFPANLGLSVWVNAEVSQTGKGSFQIKFVLDGSDMNANMDAEVEVLNSESPIGIASPTLPLSVPRPTTLRVMWKVADGDWEELLSKRVIQAVQA